MGRTTKTLDERFDEKYTTGEGCWVWTASLRTGYGSFNNGERTVFAHRFAYERAYGPIPSGLFVCHHCDNPLCVRPDHMFVGSARDNVQDMIAKGRNRFIGSRPGRAPRQRKVRDAVPRLRQPRQPSGERISRKKVFCIRGHLFAETGYWQKGSTGRLCRECERIRTRGKEERRKQRRQAMKEQAA